MNNRIVFENIIDQYDSYGLIFTKIVSSIRIQSDGWFVYVRNRINIKRGDNAMTLFDVT